MRDPAGDQETQQEQIRGFSEHRRIQPDRQGRGEEDRRGGDPLPGSGLGQDARRSRSQTYADRIDQLKLVIGLFCGWALSWKNLTALLRKKTDLAEIEGMDIPPSQYHILKLFTKKGDDRCFPGRGDFGGSGRLLVLPGSDGGVQRPFRGIGPVAGGVGGSQRLEPGHRADGSGRDGSWIWPKRKELLEFREVPEGNLAKLKTASLGKKKTAVKNLKIRSRDPKNLYYLDPEDPVLSPLAAESSERPLAFKC